MCYRRSSVRWYIACQARALSWWSDSRPRGCWAARKVEKWNESQQQRFIVLQYITQSPEIWDRHCAWLESWIPERLCHSGSTLLFVIPLSPARLQPSVPVCLSLCQSIFLYTLPALTNAGAKTTTNYTKKAAVVTADSMMVSLQHFKPCVLGFGTVCSGMFLGALWLTLLGVCVQCI